MSDNEKLSLQMLRPVIGPLLQSMDTSDLFELASKISLVAQVGAERIKQEIEKRINEDTVSYADIAFLTLYACAVGDKEVTE